MPYQAEISRDNPTCFLFVIDQSGSMDEITETGRSKAAFVADVLNKTLYTLVTSCTKADGIRSYFDVGVIAVDPDGKDLQHSVREIFLGFERIGVGRRGQVLDRSFVETSIGERLAIPRRHLGIVMPLSV